MGDKVAEGVFLFGCGSRQGQVESYRNAEKKQRRTKSSSKSVQASSSSSYSTVATEEDSEGVAGRIGGSRYSIGIGGVMQNVEPGASNGKFSKLVT